MIMCQLFKRAAIKMAEPGRYIVKKKNDCYGHRYGNMFLCLCSPCLAETDWFRLLLCIGIPRGEAGMGRDWLCCLTNPWSARCIRPWQFLPALAAPAHPEKGFFAGRFRDCHTGPSGPAFVHAGENRPTGPEMPQIEMLPKVPVASFRKCYQD